MADGSQVQELQLQPPAAGLALSTDGQFVFVATGEYGGTGRWLTALDASTWATRFLSQIPTRSNRIVILPHPDGQRVYSAAVGEEIIYINSARNGARTSALRVSQPIVDMALSRDGADLYILTSQDLLVMYTTIPSTTFIAPLLDQGASVSARATRIIYDELYSVKWLCLVKPGSNQVTVITLATKDVKDISVGAEPVDAAAIGVNDELYVANRSGNTISVVSLTRLEVIDTIDVRSRPTILALP